jgi:membrane-associated phospholipid phosphatase
MFVSPRAFVACCAFAVATTAVPSPVWCQTLAGGSSLKIPSSVLSPESSTLASSASVDEGTAQPISARKAGVEGSSNFFVASFNDFRRFPSLQTVTLLSVGGIAAGLSTTIDHSVTNSFSAVSPRVDRAMSSGAILGGKEFQFGAAFATLAIGKVSGKARVADVGSKLLRAQLLAQTVSGAIKVSVNRTRPDGTNLSFPSGHTSVSFASATVLQREFGWKVGIPAYAVASFIGASRIEDKRHFLSDVAFGAAIGLAAGHTVTIGSGRSKFAMAPMAAPGGAGVQFAWVGNPH